MKLEEFKIGEFFWTGSGKWKCYDIGTKTVIAIKWQKENANITVTDGLGNFDTEIMAIDPDSAPSYMLSHSNFYEDDFAGCWSTESEYLMMIEPLLRYLDDTNDLDKK